MKTISIEIECRQSGIAWIGVPDHWDQARIEREVPLVINDIRIAAECAEDPIDYSAIEGIPEYSLYAVGVENPTMPDYCFPDEEAAPEHDQLTLEY